MKITQQLVKSSKNTGGTGNPARYITVHETANTSRGANAQAHANLQSNGNVRQASWHYQVDDARVIQSFPDSTVCFHAGDGTGPGNRQSIAIEICVNSDGDYAKAVANAAELVRTLMARHNIPLSRVVQHNHWSGKNCPTNLRKDGRWQDFLKAATGITGGGGQSAPSKPAPAKPKPATPSKPAALVVDGIWGKATTKALQRVLGATADGIISSQPAWGYPITGLQTAKTPVGSRLIIALQKRLKVKADGLLGPATIKALQRHLGTPADGVISKPSSQLVIALQKRLNEGKI